MALKSMTGFGEGAASASGICVTVELSSVNRKQLDINVNLPRNLVTLDAQVQRLIRADFSRGRISGIVRVTAADSAAGSVTIDEKLAAQYVAEIRKTAKKLNLSDDLGAESIARLPGVVSIEQDALDADHVTEVLDQAMAKALRGLSRLRLLRLFPTIYSGQHLKFEEVSTHKARQVKITLPENSLLAPDGELLGETPVTVSCLRHDLEIFSS